MCEQSEVEYLEGDVVWVKLGPCWWPGEVRDPAKLPPEITQSLKKPPIAIVKFFQEDTYEYVKNLNQIYKYNCRKKNEFIKKGLDMHRSKVTFMDKFPADVCHAETLTGGDPDIITSDIFAPEQRPSYAAIFGNPSPKKSPKVSNRGRPSISTPKSQKSPLSPQQKRITHPRFVGKSDHEVRILEQSTPSPKPSHYVCHVCGFQSSRLNVIVLHNKGHSNGTLQSSTTTKSRASTGSSASKKGKRPKSFASTRSIDEDLELIRQGLTLSPGDSTESESEPDEVKKSSKRKNKATNHPSKKQKVSNIANNLLADWGDSDDNEDVPATVEKPVTTSSSSDTAADKNIANNNVHSELLADWEDKTSDDQSAATESPPHKSDSTLSDKDKKFEERSSCFDFKDEDDSEVLEKSPGRKIPRVIPPKRLSLDTEVKAKRDSRRNTTESTGEQIADTPDTRSGPDKPEVGMESFENILKATTVPDVPDLPDTKAPAPKKTKDKKQDAKKTNGALKNNEREQASTEVESAAAEAAPPQLPKKRIVRNFEEFENLLNEQKQAEEESARTKSTLEVSKLKLQLMSKLTDNPQKQETPSKESESIHESKSKPKAVLAQKIKMRIGSEESLNELECLEDKAGTMSPEITNDESCKRSTPHDSPEETVTEISADVIEETIIEPVRKDTESSQSTFVSEDDTVEEVEDKTEKDSKFQEDSVNEAAVEVETETIKDIVPETFEDEERDEDTVIEKENTPEAKEDAAELIDTNKVELETQWADEKTIDNSTKPMESYEETILETTQDTLPEEAQTFLEAAMEVCVDTSKTQTEALETEQEVTEKELEPMDVESELPETKILTNEASEETGCNLEPETSEQVKDSTHITSHFEQSQSKGEQSRQEIFSAPKQDDKQEISEPAELPEDENTEECKMDVEEPSHIDEVTTEQQSIVEVPPFPDTTDAARSQKMLVDISDICIDNTDNMSGLSTLAAVSELTGSRYEKPEVTPDLPVTESEVESELLEEALAVSTPEHGQQLLLTNDLPGTDSQIAQPRNARESIDSTSHKPLATLANFSMDFSDSNSESTIIKDVVSDETSVDVSHAPLTTETVNVPKKEHTQQLEVSDTVKDKSLIVNDVPSDFEAIESEIEKITSMETQSDKLNSFPENISHHAPDTDIVETTNMTYQDYNLVQTTKANEVTDEFLTKVEEAPASVAHEATLESEIAKLTDTQPGVEDVLHEQQQNTSSSKLLEILTDSKTGVAASTATDINRGEGAPHVTKAIINSGASQKVQMVFSGETSMSKKFDPKPSKIIIKSAVSKNQSSSKSNKPIILSEKIIKPVTETENVSVKKVTSKRSYQDVEDIDTFIIQKPSKKPNQSDIEQQDIILSPKTDLKHTKGGARGRGKPKIIDQTIIKAADVVAQSPQSDAQPLLDDAMFDINSMPIVLTDQILTPESLENMPVVMTDLMAGSSSGSGSSGQHTAAEKATSSSSVVMKRSSTLQQIKLLNKAKVSPAQPDTSSKPSQNVVKTIMQRGGLSKNQKVYQTSSSKLLKSNPAVITQPGKPGKFIMLPTTMASSTGSKYTVGKRFSTVKGITTTTSSSAAGTKLKAIQNVGAEPTGNKIVIVTSQQGVHSRLLLTPAQQKMLSYKVPASKLGKGGSSTPQKGSVLQKSVLTSKGTILAPVSSSGAIAHNSSHSSQATTTIITSNNQLFSTSSGQTLVTSEGQVLAPITQQQMKALKPDAHKLGKKVQLQQSRVLVSEKVTEMQKGKVSITNAKTKTILIKSSQGQTLKKLHATATDSSKTMMMTTQSSHNSGQLVSVPPGKHMMIASKGGQASAKMDMKGAAATASVTTTTTVSKQLADKTQKLQTAKQTIGSGSRLLHKSPARTQMLVSPSGSKQAALASSPAVPPLAPITSAQTKKPELVLAHKQPESKVTAPSLDSKDSKSSEGTAVATGPPPASSEQKQPNQLIIQDAMGNQTTVTEGQILALPSGDTVDGQPQSYVLVMVDESGNLVPISNDTLMSLDPSLGIGGDMNNIVLQIDQGATDAPSADTKTEPPPTTPADTHTFPRGPQPALDTGDQQPLLTMDNQQLLLADQELLGAATATSEAQAAGTSDAQAAVPTADGQQLYMNKEQREAYPVAGADGTVPASARSDAGALVQDTHTVACSIGSGESSQQLIITGDPESTQKFLASLSDGNTDLSSLLSGADGNIIINTDGQQILLNADSDNQILLSVNSDGIGLIQPSTETESSQSSLYVTQQAMKNQDILAAALADTDVFQQDQAGGDKSTGSVSLAKASSAAPAQLSPNSTLYPMNVSNVLETSLTLGSPIMTPLEVPSVNSKKISSADIESALITQVPSSLELPITITDPSISQTVSQQVMLGNELQTNLELPITISDPAISAIRSTEVNSPSSFVYTLPTLDEGAEVEHKRTFAGSTPPPVTTDPIYNTALTTSMSLPLLTEESELAVVTEPPPIVAGDEPADQPPPPPETSVAVTVDDTATIVSTAVVADTTTHVTTSATTPATATEDTPTSEAEPCTTSFSAITTPTTTIAEKMTSELQIDDLDLHANDICSSLSEPPPGMFDKSSFALDTLSYLANKASEQQTIPLEGDSTDLASEVLATTISTTTNTANNNTTTTTIIAATTVDVTPPTMTEPLTNLPALIDSEPPVEESVVSATRAPSAPEASATDKEATVCELDLDHFSADETAASGDPVIAQDLPRSDLSETPNSELNSPHLDIDENSTEIPIQPTIITNLSDNFDENNTSPDFGAHKESKKRASEDTDEESEIKKSKISCD